jgi:regulator of PEP synthase PpsR (kinase-PPPase family)
MHHIFIMSDGTGRTAAQTINAALTQFSDIEVELIRRPDIRTEEEASQIIKEAFRAGGFIVYTVVSEKMRRYIRKTSRLHSVSAIDLMGPLLGQLSEQLELSPAETPGLFAELNKDYFRQIETMEFAIRHDDGQRTEELSKAEIVLVGVSRTFKTPLSMYLAFKGWFVANVPIVLDIRPTDALFDLPAGRVFGLTTNPRILVGLRATRHNYLQGMTGEYANIDYVRQEIIYARRIFERPPKWPIINVANKPIEEISGELLSILREE